MTDSGCSEGCTADFTNYYPAGSMCDENIPPKSHSYNYRRVRSSKVKSRVAWFTRKPKTLSPHRHQVRVRPLGESGSDEEALCPAGSLSEYSSSYVSQEELKALEGCVMKRRVLFSPGLPSSQKPLPFSSQTMPRQSLNRHKSESHFKRQTLPKQKSSTFHLQPDPVNFSCTGRADHSLYHLRQDSTEYDHLEDFHPKSRSNNLSIPDSVSIQFRANSYECISSKDCDGNVNAGRFELFNAPPSEINPSLKDRRSYSFDRHIANNSTSRAHICNSSSIPGRLNSPSLRFHSSPKLQRRCQYSTNGEQSFNNHSSPSHSVKEEYPPSRPLRSDHEHQSNCNSWPRNRVIVDLHSSSEPPVRSRWGKPSNQSPRHTQGRESPMEIRNNRYIPGDVLPNTQSGLGLGDLGSTMSMCSLQSYQSSVTNASSCFDRPHFSYVKGVDGVEFKDKSEKIISWFTQFNDQQRNMLLLKLLEQSDCAQMHFLSLQMEPILHVGCPHNCQDLLSWLPSYITDHILTYLDPVSLCQASQVSHSWYHMATQSKLWMNLSKLSQWQLSAFGEANLMNVHTQLDGIVQWKSLFAEKFRLKRNWLKGYCTVRTFEGHTQGISCIQFDDTRIVSGSWDKTIKVWNRRTNTAWAALTLAGHSGTVRCLHLHGNRLVSGSSDRTIKVWDLSTDKVGWVGAACRATMVGHMHTVRCLQADDTKVISGSYDLTLKVWDIKTGQCTKTLRGHTDAVLCLQFDDKDVVSGSKDMTIKVWSLSSGLCKLTLHGHQAAVTCVQFDKTKIISGALDTLIKIWNFTNGECIRTIDWIRSEGHTGVIRHLQADSWKIISAADDKTMKVWSVHTGDRLLTLRSHTDGVTCLQFNDKVIVSGSYDKTVKLWDFSAC